MKESYFKKLVREAAERRIQRKRPNLAAAVYQAIGGTAYNQALAIQLGWSADKQPRPVNKPAGSKAQSVVRHVVGGQAFVMPHRPFRHGKLGAR